VSVVAFPTNDDIRAQGFDAAGKAGCSIGGGSTSVVAVSSPLLTFPELFRWSRKAEWALAILFDVTTRVRASTGFGFAPSAARS
jgi:hypothetical protein